MLIYIKGENIKLGNVDHATAVLAKTHKIGTGALVYPSASLAPPNWVSQPPIIDL